MLVVIDEADDCRAAASVQREISSPPPVVAHIFVRAQITKNVFWLVKQLKEVHTIKIRPEEELMKAAGEGRFVVFES